MGGKLPPTKLSSRKQSQLVVYNKKNNYIWVEPFDYSNRFTSPKGACPTSHIIERTRIPSESTPDSAAVFRQASSVDRCAESRRRCPGRLPAVTSSCAPSARRRSCAAAACARTTTSRSTAGSPRCMVGQVASCAECTASNARRRRGPSVKRKFDLNYNLFYSLKGESELT